MTEANAPADILARAFQEVFDLCSGKRKWTMHIPAEPDNDSDLVIVAGLEVAERAAPSWERDAEAASRAAHEAWKGWIVEQGYADHNYVRLHNDNYGTTNECQVCTAGEESHHPDMVPWDELPEAKKGKYRVMAKAGYMVAAQRGEGRGRTDG